MPNLTLKQQRWLKEYIDTGNATKAALKAYQCNYNSARVIGHQNLAKLSISNQLQDWLDSEDLTYKKIAETLRLLLDHRDWRARNNALDKLLKIKDCYPKDSKPSAESINSSLDSLRERYR